MTWEQSSPFAAAAAAAAGFLNGQQTAKKTADEAARQAALDKQNAADSAAHLAYENAQTTALGNTEARADRKETRENKLSGYGLKPPAMPQAHPGKHLTNRQIADYYAGVAAYYTRNGATQGAQDAVTNAKSFAELADKDEAAQIALRKEADDELKTQAQIYHWTAQERQSAKDAVNRVIIAEGHDATQLQAARMHVAATINAANIAAGSRMQAAGVTQDRIDKRQERGFRQQDHLQALRGNTTQGKFKPVDQTTKALMTKQMQSAIDAGADPNTVFAHAAQLHGIPPDEVEGIYSDESGGLE